MPALAPFFTGDVVISVPARKPCELLTLPTIDPSAFCRHCDKIGTFFGGGAFVPKILSVPARFGTTTSGFFAAGADFVTGDEPKKLKAGAFCAGSAFLTGTVSTFGVLNIVNVFCAGLVDSLVAPLMLIVPARVGTFTSFFCAGFGANSPILPDELDAFAATFGFVIGADGDDPKNENGCDFGGAGAGAGTAAVFLENTERLGDVVTAFFGGAGVLLATDGDGKKENGVDGAGATFLGATTTFFTGAGAGEKNENAGAAGAEAFFTGGFATTGEGFGVLAVGIAKVHPFFFGVTTLFLLAFIFCCCSSQARACCRAFCAA